MAPRLSRWILLTAVSAVVVGLMFLTTGGTPLIFQGATYRDLNDRDRSPLSVKIEGTRTALHRARAERQMLEVRRLVEGVLERNAADPLVLRWDGSRIDVDQEATHAVAHSWSRLTERHPEIRTVVLLGQPDGEPFDLGTTIDANGVCLSHLRSFRLPGGREDMSGAVSASAGWCLFAERFGLPGGGVRRWKEGVTPEIHWDRTSSYYAWRYGDVESIVRAPAWFGGDDAILSPYAYGEFLWNEVGRQEFACLVGRVEHCGIASGVTAAGWPATTGRYVRWGRRANLPHAGLPRELLHLTGEERFAAIWSAEAPIAESYARVMGESMDPWLLKWARGWMGTLERDNGLSLTGWLGALLWLALLALLAAEHLKQRAAT